MSNPLVAAKQDSTTWHSGINIIDDAASAYDGISSWTRSAATVCRTPGKAAPSVEADELDALRFEDPAVRRTSLLALRPPAADTNWWLGVVQHVTLRATGPDTPDGERRAWAELAVTVLETALETGGLDEREVATREAGLSLVLPAGARPESLRPDRVVRRCLDLAGLTPAEAAAASWSPCAEDVPVMRKLRRVRIVVVPALALSSQIQDDELRRELDEWQAVVPTLP